MRTFSNEHKQRRQNMMAQVIREEIVDIIRREVKDPRVSQLTVTGVDLKPDLKSCLIHVCRFSDADPTEEQIESLIKGLKSASHYIYESLKRRLSLKVVPTIHFEYDRVLHKSADVISLINRVTEGEAKEEGEPDGSH